MLYLIILFIHVTGAILLFAALGIEWLTFVKFRNADTFEAAAGWLKSFPVIPRLYMISMITILASGIYMMVVVWKDAAWIIAAFFSMILLAVLGARLTGKKMESIGKEIMSGKGELSPDVKGKMKDSALWNSIQTRSAVALGIIYLMTVKPALTASIITILVAVIIGFAPIFSKAKNTNEKIETYVKEQN